MSPVLHIAACLTLVCLTSVPAFGFEPLTATMRVTNGNLYDYVIIGEHLQATDGYDNVYDTVSPGNLNATMGQPYISAVISHPEWKSAMQELRGDIRSLAKRQEWQLAITSSLDKGTPLTIALQSNESKLPQAVKLILKDENNNKVTDLRMGNCTIPAPGLGTTSKLIIISEQP
jgi:hypothetical protein